jgi:signal transduction histidine kinase/CheY-like chemotaxis protein
MFLQDYNGVYLDYKCSNEEILLTKPENFLGKNMSEVLPDYLFKNFKNAINNIIKTGKSEIIEYPLMINEKELYFEARIVRCGENEILTIVRDVSILKEYENKLKKAISISEEMSRLKSDFLANISHEIRTPLNSILGFSEILYEDISDENYKEMLQDIRISAKRLLITLNAVLEMSHITSNQVDIVYSKIDMEEFISNLINYHYPSVRKKHLAMNYLVKKKQSGNIYAMLDEKMIKIIINNLIDNAIKFTQTGEIIVELESADLKGVECIIIKVIDTGIGIRKNNLSMIFEEFRQESEGIGRYYEGTGLGLTITKKYIELLNGRIEVKSKEGEGTVFTITLPSGIEIQESSAQKNDNKETLKEKQNNNFDTNKPALKNVLYVEDDFLSQEIIAVFLRDICNIEIAGNGQVALNMIDQKTYDLILMDMNLGKEISGVDVINEMKKKENYKKVPVIAVTAYAMKGDREEFLELGCCDYISKPINRQSLLYSVSKCLNIKP